ncbi:MAG: hypothetical protein R6U98_27170 [Pirellulaceae bacterium]
MSARASGTFFVSKSDILRVEHQLQLARRVSLRGRVLLGHRSWLRGHAGLADSLPDSRHSGICNRIAAAKAREVVASLAAFEGSSDGIEHQLPPETVKALFADCFLAPIGPEGPLMTETALWGAARRMSERARAAAQNWFHGIGFCREVFVDLEDHT